MKMNKVEMIRKILENDEEKPTNYALSGLISDTIFSKEKIKPEWDRPLFAYSDLDKMVSSKVRELFKDSVERREIDNFLRQMTGAGIPANDFYTNADFDFDFEENEFELYWDEFGETPFEGDILCIGTDEHYDYYVISPQFTGVRKVYHDAGVIEETGIGSVNEFAYIVMKFAMIQGAVNKGVIDKSDVTSMIGEIANGRLKQSVKTLIVDN